MNTDLIKNSPEMEGIKKVFDPNGILNQGDMVD